MQSIPKEGTAQYGAWKKGLDAAKNGKPKESCPYSVLSFHARRFRQHWMNGWNSAQSA